MCGRVFVCREVVCICQCVLISQASTCGLTPPLTYVYILPTCPGKIEELMYRGNNVFHGIIKLLLWFRGMLMTDSTKFCYCFICTSKLLSKRKEKSLSYFERYSLLKLRTVLVVWHTHL